MGGVRRISKLPALGDGDVIAPGHVGGVKITRKDNVVVFVRGEDSGEPGC